MNTWRRRAVLLSIVAAQIVFVVWSQVDAIRVLKLANYPQNWFDYVLQISFFTGAALAVIAGALLADRQPRNPCGVALIALGVAMGLFNSESLRNPFELGGPNRLEQQVLLAGVSLLRPILVWLLLAWPTGRLTRWEFRFVTVFAVSYIGSMFLLDELWNPAYGPVAALSWLEGPLTTFRNVDVSIGVMTVVLVVVVRRFATAAPSARTLMFPVVVASALFLVGELGAISNGLLSRWIRTSGMLPQDFDQTPLTSFGFVTLGLDYFRFLAIPLILLAAAARRRGVRGATPTVELGAMTKPGSMAEVLAGNLGDPTARILYPSGAEWVDDTGRPVADPADDRRLTLVERNHLPVAAIEHDAIARPAALESAASALGLLAEHQALDARTQARLRELRRVRSSVLEAEDDTRRRLERDLHDGAQQQILTLALQARLPGNPDGNELATAIRRVRDELLGLAEGVAEQVIAERGLTSFLEALVAMSPIAVQLSGRIPDALDAPVAATAWFIASEAVTNATKHAETDHVTLDIRSVGDMLVVAVSDDGRGGADADGGGLAGLARRVRDLGGHFALTSPLGTGTSLVASLPLGLAR